MRRLTEFEKKIIMKIHDSYFDGIEFSTLYYDYYNPNILFRIEFKKDARVQYIVLLFKDELVYNSLDEEDKQEYETQIRETNKKFFDCLNLIHLLKDNGFIYLDSGVDLGNIIYVPSYNPDKFTEDGLKHIIYSPEDDKPSKTYELFNLRDINKESYDIINYTKFIPTASLEIFVQNGFWTEAQVLQNESTAHNKVSRIVSWWAVGSAIAAVMVSGIFSALSYFDSKANDSENALFKKEVMKRIDKVTELIENVKRDNSSTSLSKYK